LIFSFASTGVPPGPIKNITDNSATPMIILLKAVAQVFDGRKFLCDMDEPCVWVFLLQI
jgi:hypothetical protein